MRNGFLHSRQCGATGSNRPTPLPRARQRPWRYRLRLERPAVAADLHISPVRAAAICKVAAHPIITPIDISRSYAAIRTLSSMSTAPARFSTRPEGSLPDAVIRACEYVGSLKRVYPRCWICKQRMTPSEHGIDSPWLYGYAVDDQGDKRCCSPCYVNRVLPAPQGQRRRVTGTATRCCSPCAGGVISVASMLRIEEGLNSRNVAHSSP